MIEQSVGPVGASAALPRIRLMPGTYVVETLNAKDLRAAVSEIKAPGFDILERNNPVALLVIKRRGEGNR